MKFPYPLLMLWTSCFGPHNEVKERPITLEGTPKATPFYDFRVVALSGDTIDFSSYKGKKVLIVNTASECGYTRQYEELQKLHEQYGNKVVVIGFPCNQFGKQEPGNNQEIIQFCKKNYGVTFQMMEKVEVKGDNIHPVYEWLTNKEKNGWNSQSPTWNFCKYIINEKGELIKYYASSESPMSSKIINDIKKK